MDFSDSYAFDEAGLALKPSYEISKFAESRSNTSRSVIDVLKDTVGRILVPYESIRGVSKTVTRDNPQCAASVRHNAERIFGIKIAPQGTAERLISSLKEQVLSWQRDGAVGTDVMSVISKGYTSVIIYMNSPQFPKFGHLAKGFQKFDGEIFVIDTELRIGKTRTDKPIPLDIYMKAIHGTGRRIIEVVGLSTKNIAI